MRKFIISLVVAAVAFTVGFVAYSGSVEDGYYRGLERVKSDFLKVQNETFAKGIFASNASFDLIVPKEKVNSALSLSAAEGVQDDVKMAVSMKIDHGIMSLINGTTAHGDVEFKSHQDIVKEIFTTTKPLKFSIIKSLGSQKELRFELEKINKSESDVSLAVAPIVLDVKLDESGKMLENTLSSELMSVGDKEFKIYLEGLNYNLKYDEPVDASSLMDYKFINSSAKTNIKAIIFDGLGKKVVIDKTSSDTKQKVSGDSITQSDTSTINKISYDMYEFSNIVIKSKIENLDKVALENIINANSQNEQDYIQNMQKYIAQILQKGPKVTLEEISLKNKDAKSYTSNFEISLDPINVSEVTLDSSLMTLINSLNFKGEIAIDVKPGEFFIKNLENEKQMLDQTLISSGVFVENGGKFESKFIYNKRTQDVVFNNKVSLKTLMSTMF